MPNDMVLFYFAGHARVIGGRRLFLATQDSGTGTGLLSATAFSIDNLLLFFDEKKVSRYVVVLDFAELVLPLIPQEYDTEELSTIPKYKIYQGKEKYLLHLLWITSLLMNLIV